MNVQDALEKQATFPQCWQLSELSVPVSSANMLRKLSLRLRERLPGLTPHWPSLVDTVYMHDVFSLFLLVQEALRLTMDPSFEQTAVLTREERGFLPSLAWPWSQHEPQPAGKKGPGKAWTVWGTLGMSWGTPERGKCFQYIWILSCILEVTYLMYNILKICLLNWECGVNHPTNQVTKSARIQSSEARGGGSTGFSLPGSLQASSHVPITMRKRHFPAPGHRTVGWYQLFSNRKFNSFITSLNF